MTATEPQTSAPVAHPTTSLAPPERARTPAEDAFEALCASSAGTSGEEFRKRLKDAQSAHNAAKRRGRFTRAPRQPGPGMIRRKPPEGGAA